MLVIGITGGVGAGKTRILQVLQTHCNCRIVLADEVGNKVKEPGQKCYDKIVKLLGNTILEEDSTINRLKMAEKIFSEKQLLEEVNQIIHPAVKEYILKEIEMEKEKNEVEVFFLEAALLIEAGYIPLLDELWYIYSDRHVREERLRKSRGYTQKKIRQIMSKQLAEEEFEKYANVKLDNSYEFEKTVNQIKRECIRLNIWRD